MITRAVVQSRKDQVEQVQTPRVCVVRCMHNTKLSLATVSVLLLYCSSLEVLLFIKSFKASCAFCVVHSCLRSGVPPQTCYISHLVTFQALIPPTHPTLGFFCQNRIVPINHYLLSFIVFVVVFFFSLPYGNWTSGSSYLSGKFMHA